MLLTLEQIHQITEKADNIFTEYDFGEYTVEEFDGWEHDNSSPLSMNRIVYIASDKVSEDKPSDKVSFTVKFDEEGNPTEAYALLMSNGMEIGVPEIFEHTSRLKL